MDKKMSLVEHLTELRTTLFISIGALLCGSIISYYFSPQILELLKVPLPHKTLTFFSPTEAFLAHLHLSLLTGAVLASPFILGSFAWFISPGLLREEKVLLWKVVVMVIFLMVCGLVFAHLVAVPAILAFLFRITPGEMLPYISLHSYLSFLMTYYLIFALGFQIPILIFFLLRWEVSPQMIKGLRLFIIASLITSAFVFSPGTDFFTQLLLFFPLYLLFELTVLISKFLKRFKKPQNGGDTSGDTSH